MKQEKPISQLKNLGTVSATMLATIGIHTESQLRAMGAVEAYCLLKAQGQPVTRNALYAFHAALHNQHWAKLTPKTKADLDEQVEAFSFGEQR